MTNRRLRRQAIDPIGLIGGYGQMRRLVHNKKTPETPISADEQFYVRESLQRRHLSQTEAAVKVALVCHFCAVIAVYFMAQPQFRVFLMAAHSIVGLASIFCLPITRWHNWAIQFLYPVLLLVLPICYLYAVHGNVVSGDENGTLYSAVTAFMICIYVVMLDPGSTILQLCIAGIISVAGFWAYENHPMQLEIAVIKSLAAFAGVGFTALYKAQHRQLAMREYHLLIRAAPTKIVRQAASSNVSIFEAFAPKARHCVCISSDWRGYQELSSKISALDLSKALGSYYETCATLLATMFPDGNFYTDWIADELFVVIFAKDEQEEKALVNQALRFSDAMLAKKSEFVQQYGLPNAIDIGISSGTALIGMMGPGTHRKATALGEVPGVARRLQAAGKLIRLHRGEKDRVIFAVDTLMEITEGFDIHEFSLDRGTKLRDIKTPQIFYMECSKHQNNAA
jgi:class 3 adenylate cyclase